MEYLTHFENSLYFFLTVTLVVVHLTFALCLGTEFNSDNSLSYPSLLNNFTSQTIFIIFSLFLLFGLSLDNYTYSFNNSYYFNQNIQKIFLIFAMCVAFVSRDFFSSKNIKKYEYDLVFLFVLLSSICLCFADDLLFVYLTVELQSLCFFVFATFYRKSEYCAEAGLKYFIIGAIFSCILVLGFSVIYVFFGNCTFEILSSLINNTNNVMLFSGLLFLLIALFFKIGAVPFHIWLCDVYEGSLTSVTIFFATAPKVILFCLVIKIFHFTFFEFCNFWYQFFMLSSLLSIFIGSFAALYQKRIKRLLAYSTISHTGFILAGLLSTNPEAIKMSMLYIIIYFIITIASFCFILSATISNNYFPKYLGSWTSFAHKNTAAALGLSVLILAVAGIPPLSGFFSKFFVLMSVLMEQHYVFLITAVIISSIACFYYIRLIKTFFFIKNVKRSLWISSTKTQNIDAWISLSVFFTVAFFLRPDFLLNFTCVTALLAF